MFGLGATEIILILLALILLFGARKLPELAKGLGQGIKEFKKAAKDMSPDDNAAPAEPQKPATPPSEGSQKKA